MDCPDTGFSRILSKIFMKIETQVVALKQGEPENHK